MPRPRYLPIGARVVYSHRAAGVVWTVPRRDPVDGEMVGDEGWNWSKRDARFAGGSGPGGRPARRRAGKTVPLDRWVHVWPELGVAFVVGLTHRSEGWRDTYTYTSDYGWDHYVETALIEHERFSLYELRKDLRTRSFIVPVWATESVPEHEIELAARGLAVA